VNRSGVYGGKIRLPCCAIPRSRNVSLPCDLQIKCWRSEILARLKREKPMKAWKLRRFGRKNWSCHDRIDHAFFCHLALSAQNRSPESRICQWRIAGESSNSWSQPSERSISRHAITLPRNGCHNGWRCVLRLRRWKRKRRVPFSDWGGNLSLRKGDVGRLHWSHKFPYDGVEGAVSRRDPAVDGNQVII